MIPNITICTAFFDIGRGDWSNGPSYLKRTTEQYFENFERLLTLDNEIVVYTSNDLLPKFRQYKQQKDNLVVIGIDWQNIWSNFRPKIQKVFNREEFKKMLHQPWNPEYWSVDYVMVNFLKAYFVDSAIQTIKLENELVAWIDFGYAREWKDVPTHSWNYDFDPNKMNMFTIKPNIPSSMDIYEVIAVNEVLITGCHIIGGKDQWRKLKDAMYNNIAKLLSFNIIDDDQSLLFMYYLEYPEDVVIRKIDPNDWFCVFRKFNNV